MPSSNPQEKSSFLPPWNDQVFGSRFRVHWVRNRKTKVFEVGSKYFTSIFCTLDAGLRWNENPVYPWILHPLIKFLNALPWLFPSSINYVASKASPLSPSMRWKAAHSKIRRHTDPTSLILSRGIQFYLFENRARTKGRSKLVEALSQKRRAIYGGHLISSIQLLPLFKDWVFSTKCDNFFLKFLKRTFSPPDRLLAVHRDCCTGKHVAWKRARRGKDEKAGGSTMSFM